MTDSLETRIDNFIQKLNGQIELVEALTGKSQLPGLNNIAKSSIVTETNIMFDFDADSFCSNARELVAKYY